MTEETPAGQQILDVPMPSNNDANAATVRGYLVALLEALWEEGESFSGKRPLGNSCWEFDLYDALARAGLIQGTHDPDWGWRDLDTQAGANLIRRAIQALAQTEKETG